MEYFDLLREDGSKTGDKKERGLVHRDGDWHGASRIWVVRNTSEHGLEILLQKRSLHKDSYPGRWDASAAGHQAAGEDPLTAVLREMEEEIGVKRSSEEVSFLFTLKSESRWEYQGLVRKDREIHSVYMTWCDAPAEAFCVQPEEVDMVAWFPEEKLYEDLKKGRIRTCIHMEEYEKLHKHWKELKKACNLSV